jgi:hypothetical protein
VHDRNWRLNLTKTEKRPTKGRAASCSGSRSRTQRAELEQEGAATRAKQGRGTIKIPLPRQRRGNLRSISGSDNDDFSNLLVNQVANALGRGHCDSDEQRRQVEAMLAVMIGIKPGDGLDGMLIVQLIASHSAAMECYRRAMIGDQTFEARRENLSQANKLSRTYAALTETLDHHRGKGQQRITVEHVNVHAGGQAIVGDVTSGGKSSQKPEQQPHAPREITHEPGIPMRSPDAERGTMPIARGARKAPV